MVLLTKSTEGEDFSPEYFDEKNMASKYQENLWYFMYVVLRSDLIGQRKTSLKIKTNGKYTLSQAYT